MQKYTCTCDLEARFHCGHKPCEALSFSTRISRAERQTKREIKLLCLANAKFTNTTFS
jgi:hypothetical protein